MADHNHPQAPFNIPPNMNMEEYNDLMAAIISGDASDDPYQERPHSAFLTSQQQGFTSLMAQYGNVGNISTNPDVATSSQMPRLEPTGLPHSISSGTNAATTSASNTVNESANIATDSAPPTTRRRARRKTSDVWKYFIEKPETEQARCLTCNKDVRFVSRTGTGTLNRHLSKHTSRGEQLVTVPTQESDVPDHTGEQLDNSWNFNYEAARDKLVEVMAVTNISFNAAGYPDFREWASDYMQPLYKPVGRQTYRNNTIDLFRRKQAELIEMFSQLPSR